tara:strand:- start:255 stop:518 length:264 start_codon:yes stop_codon:yes gene_type:complete
MTVVEMYDYGTVMRDKFDELQTGYGVGEFQTDWKAPIDVMIARCDFKEYRECVEFMTGTTLKVIETVEPYFVRCTADGYRMGPCGDQ